MTKRILVTTLSLLIFSGLFANADEINDAFSNGDASSLASHFNTSVELIILKNEDIYSKDQAKLVLQNFFKNHPVISYSHRHSGGKTESTFTVGELVTEDGTFRVSLLTRNGKIHQIRIERN